MSAPALEAPATEAPAPTPAADEPTLELGLETPAADALPDAGKPKRTRTRKSSSEPKAPRVRSSAGTRRKSTAALGDAMAGIYTSLGMALTIVPSPPSPAYGGAPALQVVGMTIAENATAAGAAWAKLADENEAVRTQLERILTVSSFGALLTAHVPILIAAAVGYGMAPAGIAAMGMAGATAQQHAAAGMAQQGQAGA